MTALRKIEFVEEAPEAKIIKPARISEVFAAITGLVQAGYAAAKKHPSDHSSVVDLGTRAAAVSYDCKEAVNRTYLGNGSFNDQRYKVSIKKAFDFIRDAQPVLAENPNIILISTKGVKGGTTKDVLLHIETLLAHEKDILNETNRCHFMVGVTGCAKKFDAPYLPKSGNNNTSENPPLRQNRQRKTGLYI